MANARLEAYKIITKVLHKNIFSDTLLQQARKKLKDSETDASLVYTLVKGVIKMKDNLDYIASQYTDPKKFSNTSIKLKIIIYLALYQIIYLSTPDHAAVNEAVDMAEKLFDKRISGFVNAVLRSYLRNPEVKYPKNDVQRLAKVYSFPEEMISKWLEYWSLEETEELCVYYNQVPKLSVRVNTYATSRNKTIEYFKRRDVDISASPYSENVLVSNFQPQLLNDVALSEGYYSIQDAAAALVVELMDPDLDESILDLFAAPGGKTTYISERMQNSGEIVANDKFPKKTKLIKHALERLQLTNVKISTNDAFKYGPVAPAFDRVLLDVPCTGWGVFQKKSELRWQKNQDLPGLLKIQESALKRGSLFVKKGGFLVYSTCTLNRDENEKQVETFLSKHPEFVLVPAETILDAKVTESGYLKILPFKHHIDGAFAALLQRAP